MGPISNPDLEMDPSLKKWFQISLQHGLGVDPACLHSYSHSETTLLFPLYCLAPRKLKLKLSAQWKSGARWTVLLSKREGQKCIWRSISVFHWKHLNSNHDWKGQKCFQRSGFTITHFSKCILLKTPFCLVMGQALEIHFTFFLNGNSRSLHLFLEQ